jgi:hypothetical protein
MEDGRVVRQGRFQVHDRVQRLVVDDDVGERVLGQVAALGDHHHHRLAHVAHAVLGQRHLRRLVEDDAVDGRRRHQQRPRLPVVPQVLRRDHGHHALPRQRRRRVDAADERVRVVAAHERRVQHSGKLHVVHEQRLPGEQPLILVPDGRRADVRSAHRGVRECGSAEVRECVSA